MTEREMLQETLEWQEHIQKLITATDDELYHKRSKVFDWLIKQAERVQELELEVNDWRAEVQKWQRFYKESEESHLETKELLHSTISEINHYKQALEEILNADCNLEGPDVERELDRVTDIALKALRGETGA